MTYLNTTEDGGNLRYQGPSWQSPQLLSSFYFSHARERCDPAGGCLISPGTPSTHRPLSHGGTLSLRSWPCAHWSPIHSSLPEKGLVAVFHAVYPHSRASLGLFSFTAKLFVCLVGWFILSLFCEIGFLYCSPGCPGTHF